MSTELDNRTNGCYNIVATRFAGRGFHNLMCQLTVGDGETWICIALPKDEVVAMCENIIKGMKEFDNATDG